ncbi:transcriptional regulator [Aureimonas sp. SA4125]|uniref:aminotransferase-like domain-containing protein n=1 Tax=Aureimonas sp. SA4125 TaxID=2826993 RepID=UPI001CC62A07|nr:PLP-dependent aminotransferase family protein [Aureimonas sp. SA4125]BDA84314.1 transcriptional regulator [Aureimonas sp. SA4125]
MTIWIPKPREGEGPFYARLADAIESAMADGTLAPAAKLPPQRNLAFDLGVTIGTVGRAYGLLRERGLVSGEIGRGTYVLAPAPGAVPGASAPILPDFGGTRLHDAPPDKLRFDSTAAPDIGQGAIIGEIFASVASDHPLNIASYSRTHQQSWLDAGALWLQRNGWQPDPADIVPTHGAHAAALAVIAAVTAPGDRVAFETLTYSQLSRSTRLIGRRIAPVETDDGGMVPEDFERVCAQQHPKVAFLIPTAHNPTLTILNEERRRAIAQIARRHDVWLIEDDIYGGVSGDPTPLIASFAPERTFVVGGLSKAVAAGVRGGWVACPPHLSQRVKVTHKMTTGGLSFILTEAAARLVLSGAAQDISRRTVAEATAREAIARGVFAGHDFRSHPNVPFIWLKLPEAWLSGTFRNAALAQDLLIDDEDEYKSARMDRSYHRVRIAFSASQRDTVKVGLERLRRLLDSGVAGYDAET